MNKVVLEHYPVSSLPPDVRRAVGDSKYVRLTLEGEGQVAAPRPMSVQDFVRSAETARSAVKGEGVSPKEAAERIRRLREEWDD